MRWVTVLFDWPVQRRPNPYHAPKTCKSYCSGNKHPQAGQCSVAQELDKELVVAISYAAIHPIEKKHWIRFFQCLINSIFTIHTKDNDYKEKVRKVSDSFNVSTALSELRHPLTDPSSKHTRRKYYSGGCDQVSSNCMSCTILFVGEWIQSQLVGGKFLALFPSPSRELEPSHHLNFLPPQWWLKHLAFQVRIFLLLSKLEGYFPRLYRLCTDYLVRLR